MESKCRIKRQIVGSFEGTSRLDEPAIRSVNRGVLPNIGFFRHAIFALLLLVAVVVLQSPVLQGQGTQAPGVTFQVEVNYVDVDVVVTDAQGNFVTGLTRDDFEVFENGKPQKIDTFSMVGDPRRKADRVRLRGPAQSWPIRRPIESRSTAACT